MEIFLPHETKAYSGPDPFSLNDRTSWANKFCCPKCLKLEMYHQFTKKLTGGIIAASSGQKIPFWEIILIVINSLLVPVKYY